MKIPVETEFYVFYNSNPKNKKTDDCVIRAISTATKIPYKEVLQGLYDVFLKTGYSFNDSKNYDKYLEAMGYIKQRQPRKKDNTKYTGKDFCKYLSANKHISRSINIIAHIGGHHIAAIIPDKNAKYKIYDIWNCSENCIGNYWIREEV